MTAPTRRERRNRREHSRSRRRVVIIVVVILVVIATGVAAYLLTRDDNSKRPSGSSTTSNTRSSSSTSSTSSSSTSSSTASSSSSSVPAPPTDPQGYAQALFAAWKAGDRSAAGALASASAVDRLFADPSSEAAAYTFSSCQGAAGSIFCSWTRPGGQLTMQVRDATGGQPVQVVDVTIGPG